MSIENPMLNNEKEEGEIMKKREATEKDAQFRANNENLNKWYMDLPAPVALAFLAFFGDKDKTTAMDVMHEDANRENELRDWEKELAKSGLTIEDVRKEFRSQGLSSF